MQEAQVVGDLLFPTDQEPPRSIRPGVSAFDNPAASFSAWVRTGRSTIAFARNVNRSIIDTITQSQLVWMDDDQIDEMAVHRIRDAAAEKRRLV